MAEVELAQVSKVYDGGVRAVKDVSLTVRDREFLVLVGPSGCGKSTLLRMIAGLEDITAGTISIGGRAVNDVPPKDRDVAMVFQNYALYPHMTVEQNMAFGLKLRKLPRGEIRERIQTAAAMLAIDDLLKRKPRELSGGQRQRVAVGRAIVRQPAVFLFDEPLSNLDAQRRTEMRRELTDLHRRLAATIVYVTHDQVEAMTLGDRIVIMRDGDVQQVGPPLELYDRPANRFVAGFLGTPPMNFWEGQLRATADGVAFHSGEVAFALPVEPLDRWEKLNGGAVTFGLRSEHFHIVAAADSPSTFTAKVVDVQPLGGECLVYLDAAGQELILRTDTPTKVTRDQTVAIQADVEHAQIFAADGENLTIRA